MDFTGMKPSDALEKAHEAFPYVEWNWYTALGDRCCAVGLLGMAIGGECRYQAVRETFEKLPNINGSTINEDTEHQISCATFNAKSFPEAIELLRRRGW